MARDKDAGSHFGSHLVNQVRFVRVSIFSIAVCLSHLVVILCRRLENKTDQFEALLARDLREKGGCLHKGILTCKASPSRTLSVCQHNFHIVFASIFLMLTVLSLRRKVASLNPGISSLKSQSQHKGGTGCYFTASSTISTI